MKVPPSSFGSKNSSRIAGNFFPSQTCSTSFQPPAPDREDRIRSANITTKCPLISAAARIGLSRTIPPIRLKSPAIFSLRSTTARIRDRDDASRQHPHAPSPRASRSLPSPRPPTAARAHSRSGHTNRIRAFRPAAAHHAPSNPVPAVSESPESRSSEWSKDFVLSTAPGPAQECRRSAPPVPLPAAPTWLGVCGACAPLAASPANPHTASAHCPDQPHRPHHFCACSLRGLYRLRRFTVIRALPSTISDEGRAGEDPQTVLACGRILACHTVINDRPSAPAPTPIHLLLHHRSVRHVLEHIVGEEELSVRWHHHHLDLVRQPLGHDLVDQQRRLVQQLALRSSSAPRWLRPSA